MRASRGIAIAAVIVALSVAPALATTFDVTRFDDPATPGTGLSLREAVLAANTTPGPHTITLHRGTYHLTLKGDDATAVAGDLDIASSVTVEGDPSGPTVIDATKAKDRAFEVLAGGSLTIRRVKIHGGKTPGRGAGVLSVGTLVVENCTFTGNHAGDSGGAIGSDGGTCTLTDVVLKGNKCGNDGGGCEFNIAGSATLTRVNISNNVASDTGGGVDTNDGVDVTITDSTISGNTGKFEGGGIDPSGGTLTLTNVTISGNTSKQGGGIQLEDAGVVVLNHVTIAHNHAAEGGGLWTEAGSTMRLAATLVAANTPLDCFGPMVSDGSNLIGKIDGATITGNAVGNLIGGPKPLKPLNAHVGPLANNGGPTKTIALLGGSPAINAVVGASTPAADQRGSPRVGASDIGAFEVQ